MSLSKYSTDTPLGRVDITKFDGTNYQRWSRQVRAALIAIEAWDLIEGDLVVPLEVKSENERRRYRTLNNRGFSLIYNSVDEARQVYLDRANDTCLTAWNMLKCLYSKEQTLERRNFRRDSEEVIAGWREGRLKTNKVMKELVDQLKDLDGFVNTVVDGGTAMRIVGNAMLVTGVVLEVFCPQAGGAVAPFLKNWGRGVDSFGVGGASLGKGLECIISNWFLDRVGATLEADVTNTNEMIVMLWEMDGLVLDDLTLGLSTFFRRRYGKETYESKATDDAKERVTDKSKATDDAKERVPLWMELSHGIGVPFVEWHGDNALNLVGMEEALRPACVHGALLAWNVYYMMTKRGLQSEAQYLTYAKAALKKLEEELESSFPRDKND